MDFAFIIPIVHRHGPRVSDFNGVEALLKMTLASLSSQTAAHTGTIVVCHELPKWHAEFAQVTFLVLPEDDRFPITYVHRHIDKAMKLIAGSIFALENYVPKFIMPVDGDDVFNINLAETALTGPQLAPNEDGWIISRGFNLDLARQNETLLLKAAYRVSHFNRHCDSCRILSAASVRRVLQKIAPNAMAASESFSNEKVQHLPTAFIDALFKDAETAFPDLSSSFRLFGDHMRQENVFHLKHITVELACKSCGHDNHVGPRNGDIHWHRVVGRQKLDAFMKDFGISSFDFVEHDPLPEDRLELLLRPYWAKASVSVQAIHKILRRFISGLIQTRTN